MILAVDSSALALLVNPDTTPPTDPATGAQLDRANERIQHLLAGMTSSDVVLVPTPVLAEVLVKAGDAAPDILLALQSRARLRVVSFDERAAIEVAQMHRDAEAGGDKRGGAITPWQKVKFDRQIIATARVHGATKLFADDGQLVRFARLIGMEVVSTWELPVPETPLNLFTAVGLEPNGRKQDEDEPTPEGADHEQDAKSKEIDASMPTVAISPTALVGDDPSGQQDKRPPGTGRTTALVPFRRP